MSIPITNAPKVGIVLVNYTGWPTTVKGLQALQHLAYPNVCVLVVDNASPDDSAAELAKRQVELNFTLIQNPENTGYAGGNNVGIQAAFDNHQCDAVWLLNNDAEAAPDSLQALVDAWQTHSNASHNKQREHLYGSVLRYPDDTYQQAGIRLNPWTGQLRGYPAPTLDSDSPPSITPVDAVGGASLFIPQAVYQQIGLLPEDYFLYVEDVAYALQAKASGIRSFIVSGSVVIHDEGATVSNNTEGPSNSPSPMAQYYYQRNRIAVLWRWLPWPQKLTMAGYTLFRLARLGLKFWIDSERHRHGFRLLRRALVDAALGRLGKVDPGRLT